MLKDVLFFFQEQAIVSRALRDPWFSQGPLFFSIFFLLAIVSTAVSQLCFTFRTVHGLNFQASSFCSAG